MRRVVYATRADELRSQMAEYDATTSEFQRKYNEQSEAWRNARRVEKKALEQEVRDAIGTSSISDITVRAETSLYDAANADRSLWDVYIRVNDNSKWDDATALAWNYDIRMNKEGEVEKETGSWSGLRATTPEQLDDLRESVRLMEKIGSIDWSSLLQRAGINFDDYVDSENASQLRAREKSRPDFEQDILKAEVEDYIGQPIWVQLNGSPSSTWGSPDREYYAKIKKETPARYEIDMLPAAYADMIGKEDSNRYYMESLAVSKQNFLKHIAQPIDTIKE